MLYKGNKKRGGGTGKWEKWGEKKDKRGGTENKKTKGDRKRGLEAKKRNIFFLLSFLLQSN